MEHLGHRALVAQVGVGRQAVERRVGARERDDAGAAALAGEAEDEGEERDRDVLLRTPTSRRESEAPGPREPRAARSRRAGRGWGCAAAAAPAGAARGRRAPRDGSGGRPGPRACPETGRRSAADRSPRRDGPPQPRPASARALRLLELVLLDLVVEGDPVHVEDAGGARDVPAARVEHGEDVRPLGLGERAGAPARRPGPASPAAGGPRPGPRRSARRPPRARWRSAARGRCPARGGASASSAWGEKRRLAVHRLRELREELLGQQRHVLGPVAQRRDVRWTTFSR